MRSLPVELPSFSAVRSLLYFPSSAEEFVAPGEGLRVGEERKAYTSEGGSYGECCPWGVRGTK